MGIHTHTHACAPLSPHKTMPSPTKGPSPLQRPSRTRACAPWPSKGTPSTPRPFTPSKRSCLPTIFPPRSRVHQVRLRVLLSPVPTCIVLRHAHCTRTHRTAVLSHTLAPSLIRHCARRHKSQEISSVWWSSPRARSSPSSGASAPNLSPQALPLEVRTCMIITRTVAHA